MKNFKEFVKTSENIDAENEAKHQKRIKETVDYFNRLKEVISKAEGYYHPGDLVAELKDAMWIAWGTEDEKYLDAHTPCPNLTVICTRTYDSLYDLPHRIKQVTSSDVGIPDISILKEIVESEGISLVPGDNNEVGIVARLYVAWNGDQDQEQ